MPEEDVLDKETGTFSVVGDLSQLIRSFHHSTVCCSLRSERLSFLIAAETWSVIWGGVIRVVLMAVLIRKEYTLFLVTVHTF